MQDLIERLEKAHPDQAVGHLIAELEHLRAERREAAERIERLLEAMRAIMGLDGRHDLMDAKMIARRTLMTAPSDDRRE